MWSRIASRPPAQRLLAMSETMLNEIPSWAFEACPIRLLWVLEFIAEVQRFGSPRELVAAVRC
jgi:hypothetical protein